MPIASTADIGLQIVDKKSAVLNLPGNREKQIAVDADHITICKFSSPNDLACELVLGTIEIQLNRALRERAGTDTNQSVIPCTTYSMPY